MALLVGATALVVLLPASGGSGDGATTRPSSSFGGTGTVERRTLAERLTVTGAIGYAGETTVLARLSGTVTALPAAGDVIRRGEPLYALDGEPVLLMYGAVPAYRSLFDGVSDGKDVEQLEANLASLGYSPGVVDEVFTYTTTEAVIAWQEDLGLEVTGEVELGRVAFLRGPQRVTRLEATLGEGLAGVGGNRAASSASGGGATDLIAWHPEDEAAAVGEEPTEASQITEERLGELERQERELERERERLKREEEHARDRREREREKARAEKEKARSGPSEQDGAGGSASEEGVQGGEGGGAEGGGEAGGGGGEAGESGPGSQPSSIPVLRTSSIRRVVSVELEPDQQSIAHRGEAVAVVLPGGAEVPGEVTGLATVEAAGGTGGPEEGEKKAVVEATISPAGKHEIPALDGASVSVRFTRRVRKQVLSVPLTALVAIGGERFAVLVLEGGARRRIVVAPGLAANGYVEVEGKGLEVGMRVEAGE
jgi:peptidoglycan hydrolase-like protein with peptidoglycan-binding domain